MILNLKLKLIDRLRATRWTPRDYWQTDNSNGLIMVIRNYHWLNLVSRVLILTCSTPLVQMGEHKQTHTIWPCPLTYDLDRQSQASLVDPHVKNQGQRLNGLNRRSPTDEWMDTHTRTHTWTLPKVLFSQAVDKNLVFLLIYRKSWFIYCSPYIWAWLCNFSSKQLMAPASSTICNLYSLNTNKHSALSYHCKYCTQFCST